MCDWIQDFHLKRKDLQVELLDVSWKFPSFSYKHLEWTFSLVWCSYAPNYEVQSPQMQS